MKNPKLIAKLAARLPPQSKHLLDELLRFAEPHNVPLYLVGGPLRDLLLDRPSLDIDIAVEGDAPALARELAAATGARAVVHARFHTATVRIPGPTPGLGRHLDLITARSETYARPGALPTVKAATIREDLLRRDFTVNALALRLNGPQSGEIIDPTGGLRDLDAKLIRVLHERSFQDDATRILRAVRYATRLGFEIEPQTLARLRRDVRCLDTISGARLRNEFSRLFGEPEPERVLMDLRKAGALHAIQPALTFGERRVRVFESLRQLAPQMLPTAGWTLLAWGLSEGQVSSLSRRLALTNSQEALVAAAPRLRQIEEQLSAAPPTRSGLVNLLSPYPAAAIWALAAIGSGSVREQCVDHLQRARHIRPLLRGDDVIALGIDRGPLTGEVLARLRAAKLDGVVRTRADEESFVRQLTTGKLNHPAQTAASSRSS